MAKERIQKVLALAGYGARRQCELLVLDGRVTINGHRVRELPVLVEPGVDNICVDGKRVHTAKPAYYLLNKPKGVICTHNDPAGRTLAVDLLGGVREQVFPVGRLDADSLGLLIMTNDGELAQKLTHPSFSVPKTYRVEVTGCPSPSTIKTIRAGTWLSEGKTAPAEIDFVHKQRDSAILEITLREGRNREIRRMLAKHGHRVRRLVRIRMGRLSIKGLSVGAYRKLRPEEVKYLQSLADQVPDKRERPPRPRRKPASSRSRGTRGSTSSRGSSTSRDTRTSRDSSDSRDSSTSRRQRTSRESTDTRRSTGTKRSSDARKSTKRSADSRGTGTSRSSGKSSTRGRRSTQQSGGAGGRGPSSRKTTRKSTQGTGAKSRPPRGGKGTKGGKPKTDAPKKKKRRIILPD